MNTVIAVSNAISPSPMGPFRIDRSTALSYRTARLRLSGACNIVPRLSRAAAISSRLNRLREGFNLKLLEPTKGFEPPTHALRKHCSTPELRRHVGCKMCRASISIGFVELRALATRGGVGF